MRSMPTHWGGALVEHGLLDARRLPLQLSEAVDAVGALLEVYDNREGLAYGFAYYDGRRWPDDTPDIVADVFVGLGLPGRGRTLELGAGAEIPDLGRLLDDRGLTRVRDGETAIVFEVIGPDTKPRRHAVHLGVSSVSETLMPKLDEIAAELGSRRRIYELDTGTDELGYLFREPEEIDAMVDSGLLEDAPPRVGEE